MMNDSGDCDETKLKQPNETHQGMSGLSETNGETNGDTSSSPIVAVSTKRPSSKKIQWTPELGKELDEYYKSESEFFTQGDNTDVSDPPGDEDATRLQEQRRQELKRMAKLERLEEKRRRISEYTFSYSRTDFPVREWKFSLPFGIQHPVVINPLVTGISVAGLWGMVIWGAVDSTNALDTLVQWRIWISLHFSWFFQSSTAILLFFMLYILWRFGHVQLSPPSAIHEPPEFSTGTYICLIFTGGIGAGFFTFSVSQTLWGQSNHFYARAGYRGQDELDLMALSLTSLTWCLSCWSLYLVVAINMSLAVHCYQLPLALRSVFYPMLRDYTWGWMGDCVDALAIVSTISGVTTSLGFGAVQIVSMFISLGWVDENATRQHIAAIQNATIWVITVLVSISVLSGLYGGVRVLSGLAVFMSCLILFFVLIMDDTKFICNLIVQELGHYVQNAVFLMNFWTDAFGQLREGSGRAVDGKAAVQSWMDEWLVFQLAWSVTWAAFVGVFIASISKGRTIREVVAFCLFAPSGFCLVWFSTMGGVGLRQSRQALELQQLGSSYFNYSDHFQSPHNTFCFDVPQENLFIEDRLVFTNYLPGVTPVCLFNADKDETAAFNVLNSFRFPDTFGGQGLGSTMALLFILASALYSVTSCDSACLVVDNLASSGRKHNHWARRLFWSLTIGALAATLLSSGGDVALRAVQAASIFCGLPFTLLMCYMMQSILLMCRAADQPDRGAHYTFPDQAEFNMPLYGGVWNSLEYVASFGDVNPARVALGMHQPEIRHWIEFGKGLVIPYVSLYQILSRSYPDNKMTNGCFVACYGLCYMGWFAAMCLYRSHAEFIGLGWTMLLAAGSLLCWVRSGFRFKYDLRSNIVADLMCSFFLWPQVLAQMQLQGNDLA